MRKEKLAKLRKQYKTIFHVKTKQQLDKTSLKDLNIRVLHREHDLYIKVFMANKLCKHKDTIKIKLPLDNGFTMIKTICTTCRKTIAQTIFKNDLGFYPFFKNPTQQ